VRIFVEEGFLGVVGAFCVAAFTLGATWTVLEGVLGFGGTFPGLFSVAVTVATMESISRRHYGYGRSPTTAAGVSREPELRAIAPFEERLQPGEAELVAGHGERTAARRPAARTAAARSMSSRAA
jgi:hypothetical protein